MKFNRLLRTAAPVEPSISVEEVRRHLVISDTTQDDYLLPLIEAAFDMVNGPHGIGIALDVQTYKMRLDELSSSFTIPIYPVRSVERIEWLDANGSPFTLTDLRLDNISNPARVYHKLTGTPLEGSITLTFTAGYDLIPNDLRHAILMIVGHLYENREATTATKLEKVPMAVETILNRYRVG